MEDKQLYAEVDYKIDDRSLAMIKFHKSAIFQAVSLHTLIICIANGHAGRHQLKRLTVNPKPMLLWHRSL